MSGGAGPLLWPALCRACDGAAYWQGIHVVHLVTQEAVLNPTHFCCNVEVIELEQHDSKAAL